MDNEPKHNVKATQELLNAKNWDIIQWPSQSPVFNSIEHAFHLLKTKLRAERPNNQAAAEGSCSKGLAKHLKGRTSAFSDVHGFQTSGSH